MEKIKLILHKRHIDYFLAFFGYFIISLLVLGQILLSPGTIGFFHDWFIAPFHEMNESWAKGGLYKWDSQIGNKVYDTDWIVRATLLSLPFLGGEALSKIWIVLTISLSGFGAFCLGRQLKLSWYGSFTVGILYIFTPVVFTRIVAGHVYYLTAYFLGPLILASFLKGKQENNYRHFIIAGLLLSFAVIQLQFLILMFIILLIFSFVDFKRIKKSIIGLFIVFSLTFLITFSPILLPLFLTINSGIPFNISQLLSYDALTASSNLAKSFRILGYEIQPYSYLNLGTPEDKFPSNAGIVPSWIFYLDFLIPIIGFSVLLFRRDKYTISFALISMIGLYLMKGLNPPFPGIFEFLFKHGFYVFRELWHVAFLYTFSITFLVAFFIERLWALNLRYLYKFFIPVTLISAIVISNGYPLLLGNFAGYIQTYDYPSEYRSLYNKFSSNSQYNVLILPYVNPIHYDNLALEGIDPFIIDSSTMIFPMHFGSRITPTDSASIWLLSTIPNITKNLGSLLSGFGIKYVIVRHEFVSNFPNYTPMSPLQPFRSQWYAPMEPILNTQNDIKMISKGNHFTIYENLKNATKIFAPGTSGGGLSDFDTLLWIANATSLHDVALYPSISGNDSLTFVDNVEEAKMPINDFVNIGKFANTFDARKGWAGNIDSFGYDKLLASRIRSGLFTSLPNSEVSFELPVKYNNKEIEIWMKAALWGQGGAVSTKLGGEEHLVSLFSPDRSFHLFKVFEGASYISRSISIKNIHGMNYIQGFYIIEKNSNQHNAINNLVPTIEGTRQYHNLIANSGFSSIDNRSMLPLNWNTSDGSCGTAFTCKINSTDGWDDKQSFQVFSKYPHNVNSILSSIRGDEIQVMPSERYELITHMKMNKWATKSHVALEGYNESSKTWYLISKCPLGATGPFKWQTFNCETSIPENTSKIRPVLNAGGSPDPKKASKTWFDALYLLKLTNPNGFVYQDHIAKLIIPKIQNNKSSSLTLSSTVIKKYDKINPTLWKVSIGTSRPTTIGFAEPYDQAWQASVYKDGKKIEVVNSLPLYGVLNAFQIKSTGDLNVILNFEPQYWYQIGLIISGLTFAFCIVYIFYPWRRDKKIKPHTVSGP